MKQQSKDDSFLQYMKINNQEEQERTVAKYESMLRNHPTNWDIDFEVLNEYGRKKLFPIFENMILHEIEELSTTEQYEISYAVGTEWHSIPLNGQSFAQLSQNLSQQSFIYRVERNIPLYLMSFCFNQSNNSKTQETQLNQIIRTCNNKFWVNHS